MTAFEGKNYDFNIPAFLRLCKILSEFGVLPEIAKAIDELEWTSVLANFSFTIIYTILF